MKKDELTKLRQKTLAELEKLAVSLRKEVTKKKLERAAGKLKNYKEVGKFKRDLAQVLTILGMKRFAQGEKLETEKTGDQI